MSPPEPERAHASWAGACLLAASATLALACNAPTVRELPQGDDGSDGSDGSEPCQSTRDCNGNACISGRCSYAGGLCGSGATLGDAESDHCVSTHCCESLEACTFGFSDFDGCNACITSQGGPRCDAYLTCVRTSCGAPWPVCDSGLAVDQEAAATCLSDRCCLEMRECASTGVDRCVACFEAGGGPVCDAAVACARERCPL